MALTKSGLYVHTVIDLFTGVALTGGQLNMTLATYKLALVTNSAADGVAPLNFSIADSHWVNTTEATGTGWVTGGIACSALASGGTSAVPTFAEGTSGNVGSVIYDHTNDTSVASTTVSNFAGAIIYADPITSPADMVDAMIVYVNFGAAYSTVAGTLGIAWANPDGIFKVDITP